ncbi:hypothetical protein, partial [Brevibacillus laterosporus]|uniref:hypothetical protein n=1 Tax=Brevibacillus laterosporus TaxID=1465 RepID=UPI001C3E3E5A
LFKVVNKLRIAINVGNVYKMHTVILCMMMTLIFFLKQKPASEIPLRLGGSIAKLIRLFGTVEHPPENES